MKKLFRKVGLIFFAVLVVLSIFINKADAIVAPLVYVNVIVNSVGGDTGFTYDLSSFSPGTVIPYNEQTFEINTASSTGQYQTYLSVGDEYNLYLTQSTSSGWQLSNVSCTSTKSKITSSLYSQGVEITVYPFSSVTCTFTNTKVQNKTPVIIVPGVMGTEMTDGSELLWVDLGRMLADIGDGFMDSLSFTKSLQPVDSNVSFLDVISSKKVLVFNFDYTSSLVKDFESQGYTEGTSSDATLFTFPYDWRYGVSGIFPDEKTNTDLLKQKIQDVMNQTGSDKVDVVAHSTGGLIVKKYLMDNFADNHIDKSVFVGVPNLGAPKAVKVLLQGDNMGIPWLADSEINKISQNMPVSYDLMPSKNYVDQNGSYVTVINRSTVITSQNLDYTQTRDFLVNDEKLNSTAYDNSQSLHNSLDDYDIRSSGVDLYNIVGCRGGTLSNTTLGTFLQNNLDDTTVPSISMPVAPSFTIGDGTVPASSAGSLQTDQGKTFYALNADHAKMLSEDGIRQEIVNLVSGNNQESVDNKLITEDSSKCRLDGNIIDSHSPIDIEITDQDGNHAGIASDGSIGNDIPNADYEVWGDQKYIYLPNNDGQTYTITVKGTGTGNYTIRNSEVLNNQIAKTEVFSDLPVTIDLTGTLDIATTTTLIVQTSATGAPITIQPSSVVNSEEAGDLIPPISISTVIGTQGLLGFYRSNVKIQLNAMDNSSGVLSTKYNLDNQDYKIYSSSTLLIITGEGIHTLSFFSTDNAGNNEEPKTITFVVDKTAPEVSIKFNSDTKDLQFGGTDNISTSSVVVLDKDDDIIFTDQAGNKTEMRLKDKNRRNLMQAEIKSISYNGIFAKTDNNSMNFFWKIDKKRNLTFLSQYISSRKGYNILAIYDGKNTNLSGKDSHGIIHKTIKGLQLLKVSTNKGDLSWGY